MTDASLSILIVDDDGEDLALVESALSGFGCTLKSVTDPHEVLDAAKRERPDIIVLDALLPGLSGFDLCKQIKSDKAMAETSVVIITGVYVKEQYRQEAIQIFRADGFLTKPFRPPELQRVVAELLATKTGRLISDFLDPLGLAPAVVPRPKKRGLLERLFRKGESELDADSLSLRTVDTLAPEEAAADPVADAPQASEDSSDSTNSGDVVASAPQALPEPSEAVATPDTPPETEPETVAESDAALEEEPEAKDQEEPEDAASPIEAAVSTLDDPSLASDDQATDPDIDSERLERLESPRSLPKPSSAAELAPSLTQPDEGRLEEEKVFEQGAEATDAHPTFVTDGPMKVEASVNGEFRETVATAPEPEPVDASDEMPVYAEARFEAELKREVARCQRVDRPLTLILVKVQDLSQIVELFGDETRQAVLSHVARQATSSLREVDVVGMMSSRDLVALVAFAADKYGGRRVVGRIRSAIKRAPFRIGEELPPIVPALAFAMASFPEDGATPQELIVAAIDQLPTR